MKQAIIAFWIMVISFSRADAQSFILAKDTVDFFTLPIPCSCTITLIDSIAPIPPPVTLRWHVINSDFPVSWQQHAVIKDNHAPYNLASIWPDTGYITSAPYTGGYDWWFLMQVDLTEGSIDAGCHYTTAMLVNESAHDSAAVTFKFCLESSGVGSLNNVFSSVKVYPNPAHNEANLSFSLTETADVAVGVYDMAGRLVFVQPVAKMNTGNKSIAIPVSNLTSGIYTAVLTAGDNRVAQTFTVAK